MIQRLCFPRSFLLFIICLFWTPFATSFSSRASKTDNTFSRQSFRLFTASDEDAADDVDLGDWRKFRASLIAQEEASDEESKSSATANKSVAKENEILLEEQNSELAKEYKSGVWAHLISEPESK